MKNNTDKTAKTVEPKTETKTHHNTNGKAVEIKKGSELDTVLKAVIKKAGMTATEIGNAVKFKYAPQRALKRLVKMGLVKKSKDKTFNAK
jgi:hypothetical protein